MRRTLRLVACAALWACSLGAQAPTPADSSAALYAAWCARCHGADARGVPTASTKLEVPPADLGACAVSSAEPEDLWVDIVARGGAAFGLSLDMPAYGDAATEEQIRMIVRYVRSLCRERGWPPGELNFSRPFLAEKAFPENEVVVSLLWDYERALVYERRLGRRLQLEGVFFTSDAVAEEARGVTAAVKYNLWHSLARRALASVGLEATPPLWRRTRWELESFLAFGVERSGIVAQGEVLAAWEEGEGVTRASYRLGVGREMGRFVPMVEAGWDVPRGGERLVSFYPQVWIRLSRLGHVAASVGAELPAVGPEPRRPRLAAFVLWDFGDGPLLRGW